jgi:hypothetical protein
MQDVASLINISDEKLDKLMKEINKIDENKIRITKENTVCAPGLKYEAGSCAKLSVLIELAKAYNYSAQSKDHIQLVPNFETLNPKKYKAYLVSELNTRIGDNCTTQKCWTQQEFVKYMNEKAREEFMRHTFRPQSPQGKFEWLSTFDINDSMIQYEKKWSDFKFFGAVPMDFATLPALEVGNINYEKYMQMGKTKLGIIFNLDDHDEPGSHWVGMFTDMSKGHIFYFDSFAVKPEPRVRNLMRKQTRFLEQKGFPLDKIRADYNRTQHQKGNSECGVYSMNFLIKMAKGEDFDKYCSNPTDDEKMNKCRRVYFDKYSKKSK